MKDSYFHYQHPFLSSLGRSLTTLIEVLRKLSRRFPQYLQRGIPGTSRGEAPNTPITSLSKGDIRTFFPFLYLTLVPLIGLDHLYAETHSSTSPLHAVKVRAEVHTGHVLIRWAATDEEGWKRLNKYGVRLTRETLVRGGKLLTQPEEKLLAEVLRPSITDQVKELSGKHPMAAILAQALWGEDFEVDFSGKDPISRAITASEKSQQRFLFSLFAADQCFPMAQAVGWGWIDKTISDGESYLYKVTPLTPTNEGTIESGQTYVEADQRTEFVPPLGLSVHFLDASALLSWEYESLAGLYSSYRIERSLDGETFTPITETPITQMGENTSSSTPITYLDSIENNSTYYYRIAGITSFGTRGEYSEIISGRAHKSLSENPILHHPQSDPNAAVTFSWFFPEVEAPLLSHFRLLSSEGGKHYHTFLDNISPTSRSYKVGILPPENRYFRLEAIAANGGVTSSLPIFYQQVDSLPPSPPLGLTAHVDTLGRINLSWQAGHEADLLGYRLYRAYTEAEELIPINDTPLTGTSWQDSVDMHSLNEQVYYAISALDRRYNQSTLSQRVVAKKPQLLPPTSPIITEIVPQKKGLEIRWVSGGENSLTGFEVYRRQDGDTQGTLLLYLSNPQATSYLDKNTDSRKVYFYSVCSVISSSLRSLPSPEHRAIRP